MILTNTPDDARFTKKEIAIVMKNLHKGQAPGPDVIDNIIIQQINKRFPVLFMELFNKCLQLGTFPDPLKLGAYRTTATSELQFILGIPPLYLQFQREVRVTVIRRLNISLPDTLTTLVPGEAELLTLKQATDHATSLPHQPIIITVDNQASVQASANPRSRITTARDICKRLITNKHLHISWIKAHVDYDGNEEADILAKEAAESDRDPISVKTPISFLKSISKKKNDGGLAVRLGR
ncbi:hypothetical protein AVEN_219007-1 [Araneus ventricosus]|uniref:Uncharacterized protein n=1 Tax=Araneus ventricosus TaxID=182803 RepID=A0A4Y2CCD2_ARAVE|nr:hypothetical protein AVEN_219007-1 [Araneus ventricosus]